jgi:hypothetical protein
MIEEHRIYCVHCHQIIEVQQAQTVFRTGFYRCMMRLGICQACQIEHDQQVLLSDAVNASYIAVDPLL